MATLILPSAVMTILKARVRAATGPLRVLRLMTSPGCDDGGEAGEAVADHFAAWAETTFGKAGDRMDAKTVAGHTFRRISSITANRGECLGYESTR